MKTAIITGVTGQDGSYLAELLLSLNYKVVGIKRRTSNNSLGCSSFLKNKVVFKEADITDLPSLLKVVEEFKPDLFFNLAAQSHVGTSFSQPVYTAQVTALGTLNCLESLRISAPKCRFYQASSSEQFGGLDPSSNNEKKAFHPRSPYGVSKLFSHWITINYRESYDMFATTGILHNHESPRRGLNFVTRKITSGIADITSGREKYLYLGNLDACRDWGHAKDYVEAMVKIINYREPEDFVVATGETHSVREFCKIAFEYAGLGDYQKYVRVDPAFYRPAEVNVLLGDYSKAKRLLKWEPKISFRELVEEMVREDLERSPS